jgi:glycosyltransferase involved in cell wall biosynthesis
MMDTVGDQARPSLPLKASGACPVFSVVVPVFNEAEGLREFHRRLSGVMERLGTWEVIYVNDGSTDASLAILSALHGGDPNVAVINLARNFGKEVAMTAGLDHVAGEAVVVIDADLQDPPEVIEALAAEWRAGHDVVYAQRRTRDGETWLKTATATAFYRVMERVGHVRLPRNTGDFRLMSRRVVEAVVSLREHHRFMKGLFAWVGFPSKAVLYDRAPRHAGTSKWNYWRLWNLALEGVTSFTMAPLRIATYVGLAVSVLALVYGVIVVTRALLFGSDVAGYPSLLTVILFLGGVQIMTLGVIGEYLGRVFNETKQRPLYFVERFMRADEGRQGGLTCEEADAG